MKRSLLSLFLGAMLTLSLIGCSGQEQAPNVTPTPSQDAGNEAGGTAGMGGSSDGKYSAGDGGAVYDGANDSHGNSSSGINGTNSTDSGANDTTHGAAGSVGDSLRGALDDVGNAVRDFGSDVSNAVR